MGDKRRGKYYMLSSGAVRGGKLPPLWVDVQKLCNIIDS